MFMTVAAAFFYDQGKRVREVTLEEAVPSKGLRSSFCWIGLTDPDDAEMAALAKTYRLHPLAVASALDRERPPKLDIYNSELFVVARTAELAGERIRYGMTAIFVGHNHLISVRHGDVGAYGGLRDQLEAAPSLLGQGADYVLHAILHHVVDQYLPIFETIEDRVLEMERRSLDSFLGREEVTRIFGIRCELTKFQRTLAAMAELVRKLARGHFPCISAAVQPYFNDVLDHVNRVQMMVESLLQVLTSVFEFSSLLEQQRVGVITRLLAAWAAILAAPTAISSIYGMNFRRMPGLYSGYLLVIGAMLLLCVALYMRFRKLNWL
jgi:magnesium transporter